jgi:hypothetical protein
MNACFGTGDEALMTKVAVGILRVSGGAAPPVAADFDLFAFFMR